MTNMDIEKKILRILRKDREGVTISEIADKLKKARVTTRKTIFNIMNSFLYIDL